MGGEISQPYLSKIYERCIRIGPKETLRFLHNFIPYALHCTAATWNARTWHTATHWMRCERTFVLLARRKLL